LAEQPLDRDARAAPARLVHLPERARADAVAERDLRQVKLPGGPCLAVTPARALRIARLRDRAEIELEQRAQVRRFDLGSGRGAIARTGA